MAGRSTRNHPTSLIEGTPLVADPTSIFEAFVHRIERTSANVKNNNNGNHRNGIPVHQTRAKLLEKFHGLQPECFDGFEEPWQAK